MTRRESEPPPWLYEKGEPIQPGLYHMRGRRNWEGFNVPQTTGYEVSTSSSTDTSL